MQLTPERMADLLREAGFGAIVNHRTSRTTLFDDLIVIAPNNGSAKIRSVHYYGVRMLYAGEREEDLKAAIRAAVGATRKKDTETVQ